MRICLVTKAYPPDGIGGAARYVYLLAHGLVAEGHDVTVIAGLEGDQAGDAKNRSAQDRTDRKEAARPSPKGVQPTDQRSHLVKVRKIQDHRLPLSGLWRKLGRGGFAKVLERSWAVDRTISQLEAIEGAFDVVEVTNSGPEGLIYSLHSRAASRHPFVYAACRLKSVQGSSFNPLGISPELLSGSPGCSSCGLRHNK